MDLIGVRVAEVSIPAGHAPGERAAARVIPQLARTESRLGVAESPVGPVTAAPSPRADPASFADLHDRSSALVVVPCAVVTPVIAGVRPCTWRWSAGTVVTAGRTVWFALTVATAAASTSTRTGASSQ